MLKECAHPGVRTVIAGKLGVAGSVDGIGTGVQFNSPYGLAVAGGAAYVADTYNNAIRRIDVASGFHGKTLFKFFESVFRPIKHFSWSW